MSIRFQLPLYWQSMLLLMDDELNYISIAPQFSKFNWNCWSIHCKIDVKLRLNATKINWGNIMYFMLIWVYQGKFNACWGLNWIKLGLIGTQNWYYHQSEWKVQKSTFVFYLQKWTTILRITRCWMLPGDEELTYLGF